MDYSSFANIFKSPSQKKFSDVFSSSFWRKDTFVLTMGFLFCSGKKLAEGFPAKPGLMAQLETSATGPPAMLGAVVWIKDQYEQWKLKSNITF